MLTFVFGNSERPFTPIWVDKVSAELIGRKTGKFEWNIRQYSFVLRLLISYACKVDIVGKWDNSVPYMGQSRPVQCFANETNPDPRPGE
ncbi:hypothetical protein HUJ05_005279 [Dendroctonus ponderosae]|nr:hypothetical protein HUJ05_005279 [Dendroctonus ponderosae]